MSRMIRALLIAVVAIFGISVATPDAFSQCTTVGVVHISGHLKSGLVRVLSCDTLYQVSGDYIIDSGAVLVVAPGVTVQFLPNGRVIDSVGGKIIADGTMDVSWDRVTTPGGGQDWCSILPSAIFATNADGASTPATPYAAAIFSAANGLPSTAGCARPYIVPDVLPNQITFRGVSVNQNSVEWGNFLILPGADSVYFRNCNFINFRKDVTVDRFNLYPTDPTNGPEILRAESNGTGAAITTFSHNTYIRGCTFRDNVARIHGGAVAFLEYDSVAGGVIPSDDGRLSVASGDVNGAFVSNVTFVNNQVLNNFTQSIIPMTKDTESTGFNPFYGNVRDSLWNVNECDGGAVYFGGSTTHLNLVLGSNVVFDRWVFNLNQAVNNQVLGSYTVTSGGTDVFGTHTQFTKYIVGGARVKLGNNYYIVSPNSPVTDNHFTITAPYSGSTSSYTLTQGARGGAIYADSLTSLVVYNGAFFQNSVTTPNNDTTGIAKAIDSLALGGAIYTDTALALLDNSSFYQNTAGNGGGVYLAAMPDTIGRILEVEGPGIVFNGNTARYNGGGVVTNASFNAFVGVGINDNNNEKVVFTGNAAGFAGGGIYSTTPIDSIRWAEFTGNTVHVGDAAFHNSVLGGGAIYSESAALIQGTDFIGNLADTSNGGAIYLFNPTPVNRYITEGLLPADSDQTVDTVGDQRELTRFLQNTATRDVAEDSSQFNSPGGRLQATGLGGAIYIRIPNNQISFARTDSTFFSRVRFEANTSYSGAAVYSDLYDMRLVMSRCLVANNMALSNVERSRDTVDGISSRIAGAILYGEFEGPLPSYSGSYRGNAVYDNDGRFIVRLPDSPLQGIGAGGVDTLRGNFWGSGTDAAGGSPNVTVSQYNALIPVPTFFVGTLPNTCLLSTPFESQETYTYNPIPIGQIPDTLLFEGRVYDLLDKGTDIKTADYTYRTNVPVEDYSLAEPRFLKSNLGPGSNQNVHRWTRDPFLTDVDTNYRKLQVDMTGPQPISYPLFLESFGNRGTDDNESNYDTYARNYTVFYVLDQNSGEIIRVNMKETNAASNDYRARVDFVPDLIGRDTANRRALEGRPPYDVTQLGPLSRFEPTLSGQMDGASRYNDSVSLGGRRTEAVPTQYGADLSYEQNPAPNPVDYFSGERYNALPVLTGDTIIVFSRSVLWKQGYAAAYTEGVHFTVGDVLPPVLTGDNIWTSASSLNPNTRMLVEDTKYPVNPNSYNYPNIPIFTVAGTDTNRFFDPRWLFQPNKYAQLGYSVSFQAGTRVSEWMKDSLFFGSYSEKIYFPKPGGGQDSAVLGGSNGFLRLWGQPHNPDVVPGGELVSVSVRNYVPSKEVEQKAESVGDFNHSIFLYPADLACDHLQQDTVVVRSDSTSYTFRVFVQDTPPVFTGTTETIANLTDSLRYCYDANTDDEAEDNAAALQGWTFPYGRTNYSFGDPLDPNVAKIQPDWMSNSYMKNAAGQNDVSGQSFTTTGLLKVETDSASAINLLTPTPQINGELSLDTVASVVCHDGHTGIARNTYSVHVNVEPYITTQTLANAKEDSDYNITLLDLSHAIQATDPNVGDSLTYFLVYKDSTLDAALLDTTQFPGSHIDTTKGIVLKRDNYYSGTTSCKFSGIPNISAPLTTPTWLKINPISGILYGIPGLNDAPRLGTNQDTVTVVVRDPYGLVAVRSIPLNVDSVDHTPRILGEPPVICEIVNTSVTASFIVSDPDLKRNAPYTDTLTLSVVQPAGGVTINPQTIPGNGTDSVPISVTITLNNGSFGQVTQVVLQVTDKFGVSTTKTINVRLSNKVSWDMDITTSNNNGGFQKLTFGKGYLATDGIDSAFCEYPLPPIPPQDVYDARWVINDKSGTQGSLFDFRDSTLNTPSVYQGIIQAGGNGNGSGNQTNYPVFISWNTKSVPNPAPYPNGAGNLYLVDRFGGTVFHINMGLAQGFLGAQVQLLTNVAGNPDSVSLEINNSQVTGFFIVSDPADYVQPSSTETPTAFTLEQNYPNPFSLTTNIQFGLPTQQNTKLEVIDVMGRVIATLVNGMQPSGYYNVAWDGKDAAGNAVEPGVYFYRLTAGSHVEMKQMTLMK